MGSPSPSISIPGKVFLLGEYAVLSGAPAWVSAISPRFELRESGGERTAFHPGSPAGKFLRSRESTDLSGRFVDPWEGRGGFGGSTAEFAFAAYRGGTRTAIDAWKAYRELSTNEAPIRRPSGADLVAQWSGGTVEWDPKTETTTDLSEAFADFPVLIFSATHLPNRKTVTHDHLEVLANSAFGFESLSPSFERARLSAKEKNWTEVGRAFSAYADSLAHLNLESPVVRNERLALSRLPGVFGAKGCGSLQTDATLVVVESLKGSRTDSIVEFATRELGLRLLKRGLGREPGIREDSP